MNKLFKLIIFFLLLSAQLSSQSIFRLKAKKEREKRKIEKLKVENVEKDDLQSDSLNLSMLVQENAKNTDVAIVNDPGTDSLEIKKDKSC